MTNPQPPNLDPKPNASETSPLRCFLGSGISGIMTYGCYLLTASIAQKFAATPIASSNATAINISVAVRTLVVGVSTLATGVFALVTVGLLALGLQISWQWLMSLGLRPKEEAQGKKE